MLKLILLVCAVGTAIAQTAPVGIESSEIATIDQSFIIHEYGYQYSYELEDGQKISQTGYYKYVDEEHPKVLVVEGSYTFNTPEGNTYRVTYIADENGYKPTIQEEDTEIGSVVYGAALPSHLLSLLG